MAPGKQKSKWELVFPNKVEKELQLLDQTYFDRIITALFSLEEDPYRGKTLQGKLKGYYSLRVWPYRIIYFLNPESMHVVVAKISHRQGSYR